MKLTDGKRIIEIEMRVGNGPDWSADFFTAGALQYDETKDAYIVPDLDYCIDQARDWETSQGECADDTPNPDNIVIVTEL